MGRTPGSGPGNRGSNPRLSVDKRGVVSYPVGQGAGFALSAPSAPNGGHRSTLLGPL